MIKTLLSIFFIYTGVTFSQDSPDKLTLRAEANANTKQVYIDLEGAFGEMQALLVRAVKLNDRDSELILLKNHCIY